MNFSPTKYYPVLLEVYAGPEFQKVQETFKTSWPQVHFPAAYEAITVSVDGRGSAYQGNVLESFFILIFYYKIKIVNIQNLIILYKHSKQGDNFMFANYKALGQTEPVDQVDFMHWFLNKSPYVDNVDKTRVACYGWSYG